MTPIMLIIGLGEWHWKYMDGPNHFTARYIGSYFWSHSFYLIQSF